MDMKFVPDVYVLKSSGALNAFATRFFGRNMVVGSKELPNHFWRWKNTFQAGKSNKLSEPSKRFESIPD
jgi:hypothetical protein